jgi:uncharacterized membrane protein
MKPNPLDLPVKRESLQTLAEEGYLSQPALERALTLSGFISTRGAWQEFINRMLLLLGSAFILAGVIFFFAYNWDKLGRFLKFGLIEGAIFCAAILAWYLGLDNLSGKVALLAAAVLVGPLLAVYGQTYQTGADAYGLFLGWAILIAGWVFLSNFPPLWFLFLILLNTSLILYWSQVLAPRPEWKIASLFLLLSLLNGIALAAWEWFSARGVPWLTGRWMPRSVACAIIITLVIPTLIYIFEPFNILKEDKLFVYTPFLYVGFIILCLWYYQYRTRDLFILAACLLSVIFVFTSLVGKTLIKEVEGFFFLSILIIGQAAGAAAWLRHITRSWSRRG